MVYCLEQKSLISRVYIWAPLRTTGWCQAGYPVVKCYAASRKSMQWDTVLALQVSEDEKNSSPSCDELAGGTVWPVDEQVSVWQYTGVLHPFGWVFLCSIVVQDFFFFLYSYRSKLGGFHNLSHVLNIPVHVKTTDVQLVNFISFLFDTLKCYNLSCLTWSRKDVASS